MNKEREAKKQRMIFIVGVFMVAIIIAWVASLGWVLFGVRESEGNSSVKNIVGGIEEGIASFSGNISDKKVNLDNVVSSLRSRFFEERVATDFIIDSMITKLAEIKIDSWSEHLDELIYFKYPVGWLLDINKGIMTLQNEGDDVLIITVYKKVGDLPDNINNLSLVDWLDEQVERELGVFSGYEKVDLSADYDMYSVSRKDDSQKIDIYWQRDLAAYHLNYNFDEKIDRIIKLIISTIK